MDPELVALQHAIQVLHQLMTTMSDPQAVATVGKCLQALTGLQQQMMQQAQQGAQQGPPQQQGGPPAPDQGNPIAMALAQRLAQAGGGQQAPGY